MKNLTLKDLAVDHDYYCSDSNYYDNKASLKYETFTDFYENFCDIDVDMNLVFRWDIRKHFERTSYYLELFMIQQRKGKFVPIYIVLFEEKDVELLTKYLKPHIEKLKSIWKPFKL